MREKHHHSVSFSHQNGRLKLLEIVFSNDSSKGNAENWRLGIFVEYAQTQKTLKHIFVLYVLCVFFQFSFDIQLNKLVEPAEIGNVHRKAFNNADEWEESLPI